MRMTMWAYAFLLPTLAIMATFQFYPMLQALLLSFTSYDPPHAAAIHRG